MTNQTQAVQVVQPSPVAVLDEAPFSAFGSITQFKGAQRMAAMLASSSIVPDTYKGEGKIGDCVIALEIANRIGASVLAVMQNLYVVYGKPGWSSQFLISCVNASRKFSPLRYRMTGTENSDGWGCIAWATDRTGEVLESPKVTIGMAKAEGWYGKNGSKWKTMPELMLRYRSATLFTRLYAPELTMGIQTTDEIIDIAPIENQNPKTTRPIFAAPNPDDGDLGPVQQSPAASASADPPKQPGTPHAPAAPRSAQNLPKAIRGLLKLSGHTEAELLDFMRSTGLCDESMSNLEEVFMVKESALRDVHDLWGHYSAQLAELKGKAAK